MVKTQLRPAGKGKSAFGFLLHFRERSSCRQADLDRLHQAVTRKRELTDPTGGVERAAHQLASAVRVFCPRYDKTTHTQVGSRLITNQAAFLDQVVPQLAEPKSVSIVVEARPGEKGHPDIAETRRITVSVFEAETDQAADNE